MREAVFYDEQPVTFAMSLRQRHRWVIGGMQIARRYLKEAFRCFARGNWSALDAAMYMLLLPALGLGTLFGAAGTIASALHAMTAPAAAVGFGASFLLGFLAIQWIALLTALLERVPIKKMWKSVLLFPVFMLPMSYLALVALFRPQAEWKPIAHTDRRTISDVSRSGG